MNKLISVEKSLDAIFSMLPWMRYDENSEYFAPEFMWGTENELDRFLVEKMTGSAKPYPLIWLVMPYSEIHREKHVEVEELCLVLAVNGAKSLSFEDRLLTSYDKVLTPLLINVRWALDKAVNVNLNPEMKSIKFPNYSKENSNNEESQTIEIWDAYKVYFSLKINYACLKAIRFINTENQEQQPIIEEILAAGSNFIVT